MDDAYHIRIIHSFRKGGLGFRLIDENSFLLNHQFTCVFSLCMADYVHIHT